MNNEKHMNGRALAEATGLGLWVIYGIKKANKIFAQQSREPAIFTGRYSTPKKIAAWLEAHPDFIARHVLVSPERELEYRAQQTERRHAARAARRPAAAAPAPGTHRPHLPTAA